MLWEQSPCPLCDKFIKAKNSYFASDCYWTVFGEQKSDGVFCTEIKRVSEGYVTFDKLHTDEERPEYQKAKLWLTLMLWLSRIGMILLMTLNIDA